MKFLSKAALKPEFIQTGIGNRSSTTGLNLTARAGETENRTGPEYDDFLIEVLVRFLSKTAPIPVWI